MPYATQSDLEARLAPDVLLQLADDDQDETADATVITAVLNDASASVDQALAARYVVPVDAPPEIFVRWCCDLAITALYLRKKIAMPASLAAQVELTRHALEFISSGLASLAGVAERLEDLATENTRRGDDPVFSDEELQLY